MEGFKLEASRMVNVRFAGICELAQGGNVLRTCFVSQKLVPTIRNRPGKPNLSKPELIPFALSGDVEFGRA